MFNHTKGLARLVECWSAAQDVVGSIPRPNQYLGVFNSWSYLLFPIKYFDRTFSWLEGPCRTGSLMSSRKYIKRWGVTKTQTLDPRKTLTSGCLENWDFQLCISQFQLCPAPPGLLRGTCPPCQSRGWGKFCAAQGPGICQPRGRSWAFVSHAVSYQKITTQRILLGKKADWLICQGQEKLKRFVKACSWFYACISSLLIEPELHSEIGSYRRESTFFGYWIKFLLRLSEKHPIIFIKLFITYNTYLTVLYYFNVNNFTSIPKLY